MLCIFQDLATRGSDLFGGVFPIALSTRRGHYHNCAMQDSNDQPIPLNFQRIRAVARLLGLAVDIEGSSLSLALETSASSRAPSWSAGEIAHPEHILLGRPVPGGLACPAIFGDWHAPDIRRMGHIALRCFVVPLPARQLLAPLLDETESNLLALNSLNPNELLGRIETAHAAGKTVLGHSPLQFVWWSIPVVAPSLRAEDPKMALVLNDENTFTHTLHDAYWRVANRARRLRRLMELGAPTVIIENERRMVASGVDELLVNVDLDEPRVSIEEDELPTRAFDALSLFFVALGSKLVEIGERNALRHPEAKSWIAKAAKIGRGQGGEMPRLLALWHLAADRPVEPLDADMLRELGLMND